jgi:hypothetical protein
MAVRDRFLQEAPGRWEQYDRRLRYLQGTSRFQGLLKGSEKTVEFNGSIEWKANEKSKLCIENSQLKINGTLKSSSNKALCVNSKYGFILQRRAEESPWVLSNVVQDNLADFNKNYLNYNYPVVNARLITFEGVSLKDIVKRKEFQIIACRTIISDNKALAEVSFSFDNKGIEEKFDFDGGKIVLDPQRFWCLQSYEAHMKHPSFQGTILFNVLERGETEGAFPWAKHFVIDSRFSDGGKKNRGL